MRLARAFNILEADRRLVLLLGLTHFLIAAAHGFFDIGATALLIGNLGPDSLPSVYLGSALALILVGLLIIPFVDRLDRSKLFSGILIIFGFVLLVGAPLATAAPELVYRALYIGCYLMKSLTFLQFWLLAGDLLDIRQAKRLFPVLLGFSLVGGLSASVGASLLPHWLATDTLLAVAGFLLIGGLVPIAAIASRWGGRLRPHRERSPHLSEIGRGLRSDFKVSLSSPLLRTLSLCLLLLALLAQVLDFLMGKAAHVRFTDAAGTTDLEALTTFYAILNGGVIGLGALLQFLLANRIISSVGVTRGQWASPLTFLGAFAATGAVWLSGAGQMASHFFVTVLASRAVQKVLRISIVRTSTDLIYNAIPSERRGRAKAFKETVIEPTGVLFGGLFLVIGTRMPLQFLLGASLLLSLVLLVLTVRLKDHYLQSLVHVLKEKSRYRFAFPSLTARKEVLHETPATVTTLKRALTNDEASVRLLAVEVTAELKEPEAASLLVDHFREEPDAEVRSRMVSALGKMLRNQHEGSEAVESLGDLDPRVRASGMESIAQSGIFRPEDASERGRTEGPRSEKGGAISAPTAPAGPRPSATASPSDEGASGTDSAPAGTKSSVRRALFELASSGEREALERLVHYLDEGDGATRHLAARALESCGEEAVGVLTLALWSSDVEARRYVIRALGRIGTPAARRALLPVLSLEAEEAYYDLVRIEALHHLPERPSVTLLKESLGQRVDRARRNAYQVLRSVFIGQPGMRLILSNLNHPDPYVRSSAIEALEVRVDAALLGGVLPLFEHQNPRVIAEHGSSVYELPMKTPLEVLAELTRHRSQWIRASALYALGEVGTHHYVRDLEDRLEDSYDLARLNAVEALGRLADESSLPRLEPLAGDESDKMRSYALAAISEIRARAARA